MQGGQEGALCEGGRGEGGDLKGFYCDMSVIHNIFNGRKFLLAKVNKNGFSGLLRLDFLNMIFGSHCAWE